MRQRIMTGFTLQKIYKNEEINLVTVNASLDEEYSTNRLLAQFRFDVNGEKKYGVVLLDTFIRMN